MNIKKIQDSLRELTPQQKIEFLEASLSSKKNKKNKKQIISLITNAKEEQTRLEEGLRKIAQRKPKQEKPEEVLEEIVAEEASNLHLKKEEQKIQSLYGISSEKQAKQQQTYGLNNIQESVKYLSPEERKKEEYRFQPESLNASRYTQHQDFDETKKLEKERKKYETGRKE